MIPLPTPPEPDRLPASLRRLARTLGMRKALIIAQCLAGQTWAIPRGNHPKAGPVAVGVLVSALGDAALAAELVRHHGGQTIYFPRLSRAAHAGQDAEIALAARERLAGGEPLPDVRNALARHFGLSSRAIAASLARQATLENETCTR